MKEFSVVVVNNGFIFSWKDPKRYDDWYKTYMQSAYPQPKPPPTEGREVALTKEELIKRIQTFLES